MTDIVIPSWIVPSQEDIELIDDNTVKFEPQFGRGQSQRQSYGAPRFKISRKHTVRQGEEANVMASIMALRGGYNTVRTTVKRILRGSFGLSELVGNNSFASGTTGWTAFNGGTHVVNDRISTLSVAGAQNGSTGQGFGLSRSISLTRYYPHVVRMAAYPGKGSESYQILNGGPTTSAQYGSQTYSVGGLLNAWGVANEGSTGTFLALGVTASGSVYSDYFSCNFTSGSRCALADNGGNLLLRSTAFDNASWAKSNCTITTGAIAPDLTTDAQSLVEDSATTEKSVTQSVAVSSSVVDFSFTCAVKASGRNFCALDILEANSGTSARQFFNLSTGAVGASSTVGANWSNLRSFVTPLGNSWYLLNITATKTNSATLVSCSVRSASADGTSSYLGNGTAAIRIFQGTAALSGSPIRGVTSTSAIVAATAQSGSALLIKGLPISTSGLALTGDFLEIGGELKRLTAPLNSDGLGLGYLQFQPEMVRPPVDNDPIIFWEPFGRFVISNVRIQPRVSDVDLSYDLEQIYE